MLKTCEFCKKPYTTYRKTRKYCSQECSKKAITKYQRKPCKICGKEFKPLKSTQQYCSQICRQNRYGGKHKNIGKGMRYCTKCERVLKKEAFYKCKTGYKGLHPQCKWCNSVKNGAKLYEITYNDYMNLLTKQKWKCGICGDLLKLAFDKPELIKHKHMNISVSVDHIDPDKGDNIENYQITHRICNASKQHRNMGEFIAWCKQCIVNNGLNK